MSKECCTRRSLTFRDEIEGELLYETEDLSWIERSELGITIKIRLSKDQNWQQTADQFRCEVKELSGWLFYQLRRCGIKNIDELPAIEYDPYEVKSRHEALSAENDPYLYVYFHDDGNWVMYEGSDFYLFMLDFPRETEVPRMHKYGMVLDLEDFMRDNSFYIHYFLQEWYDRVTGYQQKEEEEEEES